MVVSENAIMPVKVRMGLLVNGVDVNTGPSGTISATHGEEEMVLTVDHPGHGPVQMLGFPVKFSENPCRVRRPAPVLGADTDEILKEAGLTQDAIDDLRVKGIV